MFSTVDSPATRILRIALETPERKLAVPLPEFLDRQGLETRTHPTDERLASLASRLAQGCWVPQELVPAVRHHAELWAAASSGDLEESREEPRLPGPESIPLWPRMLGPEERSSSPCLPVVAARIEVWKVSLDAEKGVLTASRIRATTAGGR